MSDISPPRGAFIESRVSAPRREDLRSILVLSGQKVDAALRQRRSCGWLRASLQAEIGDNMAKASTPQPIKSPGTNYSPDNRSTKGRISRIGWTKQLLFLTYGQAPDLSSSSAFETFSKSSG